MHGPDSDSAHDKGTGQEHKPNPFTVSSIIHFVCQIRLPIIGSLQVCSARQQFEGDLSPDDGYDITDEDDAAIEALRRHSGGNWIHRQGKMMIEEERKKKGSEKKPRIAEVLLCSLQQQK